MKKICSISVCVILLVSQLKAGDVLSIFNETDKRLTALDAQMKWFLDYCAPKEEIVQSKSESNSEKSDYIEKWQDEHTQLVESVADIQREFFLFREKMANVVSVRYDQNRYGASLRAKTMLDLTKWYVKYIEDNLFPSDWKSLYTSYSEEKTRKTPKINR